MQGNLRMPRQLPAGLTGLVLLLSFAATSVHAAIPYATSEIDIDGSLREWDSSAFSMSFAETGAPLAQRNQVRLRIAWNLDALFIAGQVHDADLIDAPDGIAIEQFHQYDSIQIYLDARDDSQARMNADDIDVLILPDGRSGVLRGDDLIAELADARVPQRQSAPFLHALATRREASAWTFELRLPFAGLGVDPDAMRRMKIDVAMNDWVQDHAPASEPGFDFSDLAEGDRVTGAQTPEIGTQLWPLTWQGGRDFGFPNNWRGMSLVGQAPLSERMLRALGAQRFVLMLAGSAILLVVLVATALEWSARRRIRRVIAIVHAVAPTHTAAPALAPESPLQERAQSEADGDGRVQSAATGSDADVNPRDREFANQVLAHVRANLDRDLGPPALAAAMHVSLRTLQRRIRDGLNSSPQDLVLAARLDAAYGLLRTGRLRVSEVAFQVGFDDLSHFSKRFRVAYGIAPSRVAQSGPGPSAEALK